MRAGVCCVALAAMFLCVCGLRVERAQDNPTIQDVVEISKNAETLGACFGIPPCRAHATLGEAASTRKKQPRCLLSVSNMTELLGETRKRLRAWCVDVFCSYVAFRCLLCSQFCYSQNADVAAEIVDYTNSRRGHCSACAHDFQSLCPQVRVALFHHAHAFLVH